jgi:hypothetical protein
MNRSRTSATPGVVSQALAPVCSRVLVAVPPDGFGTQLPAMRSWLDETCGPGGWASALAGTSGVVNDAVAFYFAKAEHARAFIRRFCCAYRRPPSPLDGSTPG